MRHVEVVPQIHHSGVLVCDVLSAKHRSQADRVRQYRSLGRHANSRNARLRLLPLVGVDQWRSIGRTTPGQGYYTFGSNGTISGFGNDNYLTCLGNLGRNRPQRPDRGDGSRPDGGGHWLVGRTVGSSPSATRPLTSWADWASATWSASAPDRVHRRSASGRRCPPVTAAPRSTPAFAVSRCSPPDRPRRSRGRRPPAQLPRPGRSALIAPIGPGGPATPGQIDGDGQAAIPTIGLESEIPGRSGKAGVAIGERRRRRKRPTSTRPRRTWWPCPPPACSVRHWPGGSVEVGVAIAEDPAVRRHHPVAAALWINAIPTMGLFSVRFPVEP